jgi:hypothetical protein
MSGAGEVVPETSYVRTRDGRMIHRKACPTLATVKYGHEWKWAEGMDPEAILDQMWTLGITGYLWCNHCIPEVADV